MKIMVWRLAYFVSGVVHASGILLIKLAERSDRRLTDTYRKLW